jgi:hypothetical protein
MATKCIDQMPAPIEKAPPVSQAAALRGSARKSLTRPARSTAV